MIQGGFGLETSAEGKGVFVAADVRRRGAMHGGNPPPRHLDGYKQKNLHPRKMGMKAFTIRPAQAERSGLILLLAEKCPYAGPTSTIKPVS